MIRIYGTGDDKIRIVGTTHIRLMQPGHAPEGLTTFIPPKTYVLLSTGTVIAISKRDIDGGWRAVPYWMGNGVSLTAVTIDKERNDTGIDIEIEGDLEWLSVVGEKSIVFKMRHPVPKQLDMLD